MLILFQQQGAAAITGTGAWVQAPATWAATATETHTASAAFEQGAATWTAVALQVAIGTGSFTQAAAVWNALAAEAFSATSSLTQAAATWTGEATETFAGSAAFVQGQAWDAAASVVEGLTFSSAWGQPSASWSDAAGPPAAAATVSRRAISYHTRSTARAAFAQAPASWGARLAYRDDEIAVLLEAS